MRSKHGCHMNVTKPIAASQQKMPDVMQEGHTGYRGYGMWGKAGIISVAGTV
jgi:hypothetical protein